MQLGANLDARLVEEFRAFVRRRRDDHGFGESIRAHLELALRRHLDDPPPPLAPRRLPPTLAGGRVANGKPATKKRVGR